MNQAFLTAIEQLVKEEINDLHTAVPATIVEYNYEDGTVDVEPKAKLKMSNGKEFPYPRINGVPLVFPCSSGQKASIVLPVKAGDGCLLIFSEQSLDYWRSNGLTSSEMKFALSNAIAIPGLFTKPLTDIREAVETDSVIIRNGDTKISLTGSKIVITGDIELDGNLTLTGEVKHSLF